MIEAYIYGLISVLIVSCVSLVGVMVLGLQEGFLRKYMYLFISLAVGALLGDAFIHLVPEALEGAASATRVGVFVILGILLFFILEKFLHWHHHGDDKDERHVQPVGQLILFSDGVHNFIDGIIIGVSFLVSVPVGIATTLAVVLHEIPQEIGDFVVLLHSGYTKKQALFLNFVSALTAVLGLGLAFVMGSVGESFNVIVLSLVAGGFVYIAVADLIPELHKTKHIGHSALQLISVVVGILAMVALLYLE